MFWEECEGDCKAAQAAAEGSLQTETTITFLV